MSFSKNVGSLFAVQIVNQAIPLITLPYLTRMLGLEAYGVYAFMFGVFGVCLIILDFGFNLWAVGKVAEKRDDYNYIKWIYSAVGLSKIFLFLFVSSLYILLIFFLHKYENYRVAMILYIGAIFFAGMQPGWFFTGIEKNYVHAFFVFLSKLIFLISIFIFVKSPDDLNLLVLLFGFSHLFLFFLMFIYLKRMGVGFDYVSFNDVKYCLRESLDFFISRVAVACYSLGGVIILGIFSSAQSVAVYSVAEQLYKGAQSLISPINQVIYPYMMRTKNFIFLYKSAFLTSLLAGVGVIFTYYTMDWFILNFFGKAYENSKEPLRILILCVLVSTPSIFFGYPFLGAKGMLYVANKSVVFASIFLIILFFLTWLFYKFTPISVSLCILCAESFVLIFRIVKGRVWDLRGEYK